MVKDLSRGTHTSNRCLYLENQSNSGYRKPNWLVLKEAAQELMKMEKSVFTRKELTNQARRIDPSRSEASLDFEIDLVTINSNSKDRYKDPDKLFLYRIDRGRYTLYNPEIHGSLDDYILHRIPVISRDFISQVIEKLSREGYVARENKASNKPWAPMIIAEKDYSRIGVWVIDPNIDKLNQYKILAYIVGSSILNKSYEKHLVIAPQNLMNKIPSETREALAKHNIILIPVKEERIYNILI